MSAHGQAINIARRLSNMNEPDLLRKYLKDFRRGWKWYLFTGLHYASLTAFGTMLTRDVSFHPTEEDMMSEGSSTPPGSPYTAKTCFSLLDKVGYDNPLPRECEQYQEVKVALKRKNSNKESHAIAFQGMGPAEAAAAMAARERGHLHHAQIQRRLTTSNKRSLW